MPAPTTNAQFIGPTTVAQGGTSTAFTITPFPIPITGTYTPNDGGFGGTFTPASLTFAASSTPQTFVYNAPAHPGIATITPVWTGSTAAQTAPVFLNITVTGANPAQHLYQFPQIGGVPPFQILATNDQIPGANIPFKASPQHLYQFPQQAGVPPFQILITNNQIPAANMPPTPPATTTTAGSFEAGAGTIAGLAAGTFAVIMGPINTPFRTSMRDVFNASASGAFNLDYQYTIDGGMTWLQGPQVASSTVTPDGTSNTQSAHLKISTGFQWQVLIYNTGASPINVAWEKRLFERGIKSS